MDKGTCYPFNFNFFFTGMFRIYALTCLTGYFIVLGDKTKSLFTEVQTNF